MLHVDEKSCRQRLSQPTTETSKSGSSRRKNWLVKQQLRLSKTKFEDVGMEEIPLEAIRGGNAKENADILVSCPAKSSQPLSGSQTVLNAGLELLC